MKKLFISQPMKGKSDEDILAERKKAIQAAEKIVGEPVEIIDSFFQEAPADAKPLWFLGKSLELLAGADVAYFAPRWEEARGCKIEHTCAVEYGIPAIKSDTTNENPYNNMDFNDAFKLMKLGCLIKLPSWGGYWYWDDGKQTIVMHTKDGEELDIRETQRVQYTLENILSDEWQVANEKNCPQLGGEGTFSFGDAIKFMKRGFKVARKGWNGKSQYIQLANGISYKTADGDIVNCEHDAIGNMAIAFCGTSGIQMGWLASQADMLADDWVFVE